MKVMDGELKEYIHPRSVRLAIVVWVSGLLLGFVIDKTHVVADKELEMRLQAGIMFVSALAFFFHTNWGVRISFRSRLRVVVFPLGIFLEVLTLVVLLAAMLGYGPK